MPPDLVADSSSDVLLRGSSRFLLLNQLLLHASDVDCLALLRRFEVQLVKVA